MIEVKHKIIASNITNNCDLEHENWLIISEILYKFAA